MTLPADLAVICTQCSSTHADGSVCIPAGVYWQVLLGEWNRMRMGPWVASRDMRWLTEHHWSWLNTTLSTSTADWLMVIGHHPVRLETSCPAISAL